MIWTREDEMALASCYRVKETADRYKTLPVPVYRTLLKMYRVMEEAGLIERELIEPTDICAGCVNHQNGTCRKEYRKITMGFKDEKIVRCEMRRERKDPFPEIPKVKRVEREPGNFCDGCAESINGACGISYRTATLNEDRSAVVECRSRRELRR